MGAVRGEWERAARGGWGWNVRGEGRRELALEPAAMPGWNVRGERRRELAREPKVRELIQGVLDAANAKYAPVEQIKRFAILDHDLSQETGELTPTLKVKRNIVNDKYADRFDALYGGAGG